MSVLVIGASSEIAQALLRHWSLRHVNSTTNNPQTIDNEKIKRIVAVSRSPQSELFRLSAHHDVQWLQSNYTDSSIGALCEGFLSQQISFNYVFICNGVLHGDNYQPEKKLADLDEQEFHTLMHINALVPLLWLKHLQPVLRGASRCIITVFSARVGSIADNQLGGWYSYRMAKAALNMGIKSAAVEYRRNAKTTRLLAFHPGTTDTPLSQPFQKNVHPEKLFSPDFVAERVLEIVESMTCPGEVQFLDWAGASVPW